MKIGENEMERIKTKDRILLAALDLFSQKGYDQTSIDLIAEAVGIKGPSIYAHYKGKEDILDSLITILFHHGNQRIENVFLALIMRIYGWTFYSHSFCN